VKASLEAQRIRNLYRRLVLLGVVKLPLAAARKLVGPDCAYHLYFRHARGPAARKGRAGRAARRRGTRRAVRARAAR
jgi:hypothetical protein